MDQLYFENFKAARDEEERLAKEAAAKARQVPPDPPPRPTSSPELHAVALGGVRLGV